MQNNLCPQCQSPIPADAPGGICPGCALLGVALPTSPTQVAGASVPMLDEVAAAFPELEVLELFGQGGMGVVFKARQPKLDRFVALKILTPALATQPGFSERFTREARALAKLSHPNIVGVHDFGESGGFFYLLMEFVDGVNLRQAMRAGVTPEQALLLVPKVCEALQFAHDHGVLHRDIKPENILLDTHGVPKLADFGIAKFVESATGVSPVNTAGTAVPLSGLTQSGMQLGTAAYMAPEQIEQPATVDHRADIYSLGVVLYELLTGELPLGRFAAPSEKMHCSSGVDDVVLRALEKQRERRQQSATEMKTQVEGASERTIPPPTQRRIVPFSNAAAVGASVCIASIPFGLILFLFVKAMLNPSIESSSQLNGPVAGNIIIFGFIPAFIGVALGWKSVGDFRYHRGHLRGGGTAVFAALGIPVFALIVTALVNFADIDRAINPSRKGSEGTIVACLVILAAFAASIWAVKALWRFVHTGPPGVPIAPPNPANWPRRVFILIIAFIGVPVLLLAIYLIIPMLSRRQAPPTPAVPTDIPVEIQADKDDRSIQLAAEIPRVFEPRIKAEIQRINADSVKKTTEIAKLKESEPGLLETFFPTHAPIVELRERVTALQSAIHENEQRVELFGRILRRAKSAEQLTQLQLAAEEAKASQAANELLNAQTRTTSGVATPWDERLAELKYLTVLAGDDRLIVAELKAQAVKENLLRLKSQMAVGAATPAAVSAAEVELAEANAELERLQKPLSEQNTKGLESEKR